MIELDNNDRIIGDFLEINADIVSYKQLSKSPKFITNFSVKRKRKRLRKMIDKLKETDYVLNKNNLIEIFAYIYNNFPPYGRYGSIYMVKMNDIENTDIEAVIRFDNIVAVITIEDRMHGFGINIKDSSDPESLKSCSVNVNKLESKNKRSKDLLKKINERLFKDMIDYIESIILLYEEEK